MADEMTNLNSCKWSITAGNSSDKIQRKGNPIHCGLKLNELLDVNVNWPPPPYNLQ